MGNLSTIETLFLLIICFLLGLVTYLLVRVKYLKELNLNKPVTNESSKFKIPTKSRLELVEFYNKINEKIKECCINEYVYIVLDIDDFKMINKLYGEVAGDELLDYIGRIITRSIKRTDYFTRVEADIFAILMKKGDDSSIWYKRAENIISSIRLYHKHGLDVIPSMGVYNIETNDIELSTITTNAYLAKRIVKGNKENFIYVYGNEETEQFIDNKKLVLDFKKALVNREFQIYFQPQNDIRTNEIKGAEALVRWFHKERGIIPPLKFISLFEETGDIVDLDLYVFEETCRILSDWKSHNYNLDSMIFSVNMSRRTFIRPYIALKYFEIAESYSINPSMLELELTESIFLGDNLLISEQVQKFRDYGFNISIDDFGSGYSSLNVLKDMDITTLKIDKGFLETDLDNDYKATNIIEAIVKLAKDINVKVIVEGIETESQRIYLSEVGCDLGQGYLFSKPIPFEEFRENYLIVSSNI